MQSLTCSKQWGRGGEVGACCRQVSWRRGGALGSNIHPSSIHSHTTPKKNQNFLRNSDCGKLRFLRTQRFCSREVGFLKFPKVPQGWRRVCVLSTDERNTHTISFLRSSRCWDYLKKTTKEEKREAVSSGRQSGAGEPTVSAEEEEEEEFQWDCGSAEESLTGCPG